MTIAAIMPCLGRAEQTVRNVERLLATAGYVEWGLICIVDRDKPTFDALLAARTGARVTMQTQDDQPGYWWALANATHVSEATHLIGLANDLWACDGWLATAVEEYQHHFGDGSGLLGFAGDGHGPQHSCHFLIARSLLDRYGGWPVWYSHNFGDAELCARAQADRLYAKAERAYLEHCHVERGLAADDAVYQAGRATYKKDEALFVERRRLGWPHVSP